MADVERAETPRVVLGWLREARSGGVHLVSRIGESFVPWSQVYDDVDRVAQHLARCGFVAGDRVGIRGDNCYEWLVLDLALLRLGAVPVAVPVPDFAGHRNTDISDQYGLVAMFAAGANRDPEDGAVVALERLLELPPVTRDDPPSPAGVRRPQNGRSYFTLAFSSGTAGRVKCLLMYWPGVRRLIDVTSETYSLDSDDRIMIALPLSTFQQRYLCYLAIRNSCSVVLTTTAQYLHALRVSAPTVLLGPPNFYDFAAVRFGNERRLRRIARWTTASLATVVPSARLRTCWRRWVFRPYHEMFGGRARLLLVGSAPVRREMLRFFAEAGFELHQIYGMTEIGYIAWNRPGASRLGSVGRETYPGSVRLAEDGEVLVSHSWHICCGYEGESPAAVDAVFRADNVIATGDLGHFLDGFLYLKGRKKNLVVTAGGQKVSFEELEDELAGAVGVNQVAIIDASDQGGFAVVAWYLGDRNAAHEELRLRIQKLSRRLGVGVEIRQVALIEGEVSQDSRLLNRNLKLDRPAVRAAVKGQLEAIE